LDRVPAHWRRGADRHRAEGLAHDFKNFDPLKDVRSDVEAMGKDIESSLAATPKTDTPVTSEATPAPQAEAAVPAIPVERSELDATSAPVTTNEPAADVAAPVSVGRSE
jgi:hypothetical protein